MIIRLFVVFSHGLFTSILLTSLIYTKIALHSVQIGAATLHSFETLSGLRFALYTSNDVLSSKQSTRPRKEEYSGTTARDALKHIYANIWVEHVVRSPLYNSKDLLESNVVGSTNFEKKLDEYISSLAWSRE